MIDFKQLLKDNPRFNKFDEIHELISKMEEALKKAIIKHPDNEEWIERYSPVMSKEALKEVHAFIINEYIIPKKTQMLVSWEDEQEYAQLYKPAGILFSIRRDMLN